jgi:hypothetical protein
VTKTTNKGVNFRKRVALLSNTPVIRLIDRDKSPKWTVDRRQRVAMANNNGGMWWVCISNRSVADIERRFAERSVGRVLYEVVGGILGDHRLLKTVGGHWLYMQLSRRDELIDIALRDVGVWPKSQIKFDKITLP